jgi:adenylyl-sulfate kinase
MAGVIIWLTGLSGSGKSTISETLLDIMSGYDYQTVVLDGDNIRKGLSKDLGFSLEDRKENIRRISEVCKIFSDNNINVITAFISPMEEDRNMARDIIGEENFIEVFVDCPLEICEERDPKGLYKKARNGEIPNFTGIYSPYIPPKSPSVRVQTDKMNKNECARIIFESISQ